MIGAGPGLGPSAEHMRRPDRTSPPANRVEDPEVGRRVGAAAGRPLPAQRVVREIGIDERVPEPAGALPARGSAGPSRGTTRRSCGRDCASSRWSRARACPHRRSGSRCGRFARRSALRVPRQGRPRTRPAAAIRRVREMVEQVMGELAPADLAHVLLAAATIPGSGCVTARAAIASTTCRGPISPKCRCGESREPRRDPADPDPTGYALSARRRKRRNASCAPASPGVHAARNPPAQPMRGSSSRPASGRPEGHRVGAGRRRGAGNSRVGACADLPRPCRPARTA